MTVNREAGIPGLDGEDELTYVNVIGGKGSMEDGRVILLTDLVDVVLTKNGALRLAYRLVKHVILESVWL